MTIVLVGGGLTAARVVEAYREAGGKEDCVCLSADTAPPYHRPPLSKRFLRGEAEAEDALVHPAGWYAEHGCELRLGVRAARLDAEGRAVELEDGSRAAYDTLVVASGALPRTLPGAHAFRTLDDAREVRERARELGRAAVVGTGFIGMETTASLTQLGVRVTLVSPEPPYGAFRTPALSGHLELVYRERGVDLRLGEAVSDASSLGELVIAGIGVTPATGWLDGMVETDDGVVVNERYETSLPGVYAAGDVARFHDPVFGVHRRIEHWSNANYQGAQLGRILAGSDERYDTVSSFFTEVFGIGIRVLGALELANEVETVEDFSAGKLLVLHRRDGALVGAVISGQDDEVEAGLKERIATRSP